MPTGTQTVAAGATSQAITGSFTPPYVVTGQANWLTDISVTTKATNTFTLTFGTPPPIGGGSVDWTVTLGTATVLGATPANLTYVQLETRVMNNLRLPTTNATIQAQIQAIINEVYRDICAKHDWWWLVKRQVINTSANFTTGTVNIAALSTSGTITSTASIPALAGYRFLPTGDSNDSNAAYIVGSTHAAGNTVFPLDAPFTGATGSAYAFVFSQDAYPLAADTGKVLQVRRYGRALPLKRVGWEELSRIKLIDRTANKPEVYTVWDFATSGDPTTQKQLIVHPYPDKAYRLEVSYKQTLNTELSGTTRPLIPDDYVEMLVYGSLARGYPIFLNDLERGKFFQSLFNDLLALMTNAQCNYEMDRPGLAPDDTYRGMANRRRRTASGYTMAGLFDRLPNIP